MRFPVSFLFWSCVSTDAQPLPTGLSPARAERLPSSEPTSIAHRSAVPGALQSLPPRRREREAEASKGALARPSQIDFRPDHIELAAYLLARDAVNRPTPRTDARTLIYCNESVQQTRAMLSYGRGNVDNDVLQTDGMGFYRAKMLRKVRKDLSQDPINQSINSVITRHVVHAASSMVAEVANCDGHAALVAHIHAPKLQEGESLVLVGESKIPHAWCELRKEGHPTIVLDAWAEGPPKFAEDVDLKMDRFHGTIDLGNRDLISKQREKNIEKLRSPDLKAEMSSALKVLCNDEAAAEGESVFSPTNFTGKKFAFNARGALQSQRLEVNLDQASHILNTTFGLAVEGVKQEAPRVVAVAKNLRRVKPRQLPGYPPLSP